MKTRKTYKWALRWLVNNDDTEFLDDENPSLSVTASFVADLFDKDDDTVMNDLRKEKKKDDNQS